MDLRILVVDDSATTRGIIRAIIHSREWTVCEEASSGWEGLSKFESTKPDLVLIDLAMPDLNGFEVARRMASLDSKVPLILFTVLDIIGLEKQAHAAGITAVVSKAQAWDLVRVIETTAGSIKNDSAMPPH
jgi:CheY-like chemotaxis protein